MLQIRMPAVQSQAMLGVYALPAHYLPTRMNRKDSSGTALTCLIDSRSVCSLAGAVQARSTQLPHCLQLLQGADKHAHDMLKTFLILMQEK